MNIAQLRKAKAIEKANKQRILKHFPNVTEDSGIYILTREENGFKYAYVGQATHLLTRLAQHLKGFQHIDLSIKNHGLYSDENKNGWYISILKYPLNELNTKEQEFIKEYANAGFQMRNKTSGSQDIGKKDIAEAPTKGYQQGLHNGYEKARKEVAKLFEKNLIFGVNGKTNKYKEKAFEKFMQFIDVNSE